MYNIESPPDDADCKILYNSVTVVSDERRLVPRPGARGPVNDHFPLEILRPCHARVVGYLMFPHPLRPNKYRSGMALVNGRFAVFRFKSVWPLITLTITGDPVNTEHS